MTKLEYSNLHLPFFYPPPASLWTRWTRTRTALSQRKSSRTGSSTSLGGTSTKTLTASGVHTTLMGTAASRGTSGSSPPIRPWQVGHVTCCCHGNKMSQLPLYCLLSLPNSGLFHSIDHTLFGVRICTSHKPERKLRRADVGF